MHVERLVILDPSQTRPHPRPRLLPTRCSSLPKDPLSLPPASQPPTLRHTVTGLGGGETPEGRQCLIKPQNIHNLLNKKEAKLCGPCGVTTRDFRRCTEPVCACQGCGAGKQLQVSARDLEEAGVEGRAGEQTDGATPAPPSWLKVTLYPSTWHHLAGPRACPQHTRGSAGSGV